jgi:hypothetical protein
VSRRQALLGLGTVATGGVGLAAVVPDRASAQVSVDSFAVSDGSFTTDQADPVVDVTVAYDYDVGTSPVATLRFELLVGDSVVASDALSTSVATHNGTVDLSGRVVDSEAWAAGDFAPAVASRVSHDLTIGVRFAVLNSSGSVIVEDTATDSATVTVSHPQETQYVIGVGGSGEIRTADGS